MVAGEEGIADDGVLVDTGQAASLADADAFRQVPQDIKDFVRRQPRIEEGSALAFGEACLAGAAIQQAALVGQATACRRWLVPLAWATQGLLTPAPPVS